MTVDWTEAAWPEARLGEAIEALGRRLRPELHGFAGTPPAESLGEHLGAWIEAAADRIGLEAEPVEVEYAALVDLLAHAGPAVIRLPGDPAPRFLVLLGGGGGRRRRRVAVVAPGLTRAQVMTSTVCTALRQSIEAPIAGEVDRVLDRVGVRGRRRHRAWQAILRERLAAERIGCCWQFRPSWSAGLKAQAREAALVRPLAVWVAAQVVASGLWVVAWWLLGWLALMGRFEPGWLAAWLLILLSIVPARVLATRAAGLVAIRGGSLLKRRLLAGALRMAPDEVRRLGVGQLLGWVLESEVLESLALTGAFLGLAAVVELGLAGMVLGIGAGSPVLASLLTGWSLVVALHGLSYFRRRRLWTDRRLAMTAGLVEGMIGHRTRLAQECRIGPDEEEDRALEDYLRASRELDGAAVRLQVMVSRGWFLVGLLGLAPAFVAGGRAGVGLAIGVGGVLLGVRGFRDLAEGFDHLAGAAIAWRRLQPLWHAAARREPIGDPRAAGEPPSRGLSDGGAPVLEARDLGFRYPDRPDPVLREVDLRIGSGDRVLLEGSSGAGKSTLAALLAGSRVPSSGLLLLNGLDRETVGSATWRSRVVLVPQFHENHVLVGSFAFNLLMGSGWPPRTTDLGRAARTCRALGLGPLLDRMPAGLFQPVGETGWQLSHGERGRLFLARALLQGADVLILDESFAALDPPTLRSTLAFVLDESATLLYIAHP
jgi:ATP-binding cassette subfamily B protein